MAIYRLAAQKYVTRLLTSEHESLKWAWMIIMSGSLVEATFVLSQYTSCVVADLNHFLGAVGAIPVPLLLGSQIHNNVCPNTGAALASAACFGVFLLTFLRFYWGDNRLLDAKYKEVFGLLQDVRELELVVGGVGSGSDRYGNEFEKLLQNVRVRCVVADAFFILLHGVLFALLAKSIADPAVFCYLYLVLMLFNSGWLLLTKLALSGFYGGFWKRYATKRHLTMDLTASTAPWFWIVNNLVCSALLVGGIFGLYERIFRSALPIDLGAFVLLVMFANCIADIWMTWNAYFPRVRLIYDELSKASAAEQP